MSSDSHDIEMVPAGAPENSGQERGPLPYTVESTSGREAEYTPTLNETFLDRLFDPQTPLYHALPGKTRGKETVSEDAPAHSAVAGAKVVRDKDVDKIYTDLRETLKRHPQFGSAKASWKSTAAPSAAPPQEWTTAEELCNHLKKTLFSAVGAILRLLPNDYKLDVVGGDGPTSVFIVATLPTTMDTRVVMVIDVMPWIKVQREEYMNTLPDEATPQAVLRLPASRRVLVSKQNVALQRLALRMRACNAPFGVLYNGENAVPVERDFEHDLMRMRQLAPDAADGDSPTLDLNLTIWGSCFTHPAITAGSDKTGRADNPAACFAALALYALDRMTARPDELDDAKSNDVIHQFMSRNGKCPCQALPQVCQEQPGSTRLPYHEAPSAPAIPASVIDLLQRIEATRARDSSLGQGRPTNDERLIAVGAVPCSLGGNMPYVLVASEPTQSPGRFALAYPASLFVVTEASKSAAATEAVMSTLTVVSERASTGTIRNIAPDHSVRVSHLYRTRVDVVDEVLKSLNEACGEAGIFCQSVFLKLPNLVGRAWLSRHPSPESGRDSLLCKCPLGLCDAVCPRCTPSSHEYGLAAVRQHIESLILSFKVEHAARASLAGEYEQVLLGSGAGTRRPCFSRLVGLQLALRTNKPALAAKHPLLGPLLDRTWPVYLDAGRPVSDVLEYAELLSQTPLPTAEKLSWTESRFKECQELFAHFTTEKEHLFAVLDETQQHVDILLSRELAHGQLGSDVLFVSMPQQRTLDLFSGAVYASTEEDKGKGEGEGERKWPAYATLMGLSACRYLGDPAKLDAVEAEVVEEAANPRGLAPVKGPMPHMYRPWQGEQFKLNEVLHYEFGEFVDEWFREDEACSSASAAPVAAAVEGERLEAQVATAGARPEE